MRTFHEFIEIIKNTAPKLSKLSKHLHDEVKIPSPGGGLSCQVCGTRKTGQWRRGPNGPRTLCNGCGLSWAKSVRGRK